MSESPSFLQLLMPLAVKLLTLLLQNHTLLAGKCPCSAAVLVTCRRGGTQLEGLPGVFPSPPKGFTGDAWLTDSRTAAFGIQPAFHAFVSMAKYEKALCRMNIDHKNNSKVVYKLFCQSVAVPATVRVSAPFL